MNTKLFASRTLDISIARDPDDVYDFVANPENLTKWAAGLGGAVRRTDGGWVIDAPQGPVGIRFVDRNNLGVLDHVVTLAPGIEVYVPLRVIRNAEGSEVIFTLFRTPEMSEEQFREDAARVEQDLRALKALLEA